MTSHYLSLIDKIDDIKNHIREDKYLDIMNTIKILYDNSLMLNIDDDSDSDSDFNYDSDSDYELNYHDNTPQDMLLQCLKNIHVNVIDIHANLYVVHHLIYLDIVIIIKE